MSKRYKKAFALFLAAAMVMSAPGYGSAGVYASAKEAILKAETTAEEAVSAERSVISIDTAETLAKIGRNAAYPLDGDYVLTADLDLSSYTDWDPIGGGVAEHGTTSGDQVFSGTFDGQGHVIRGLTIDRTVSQVASVGLFGIVGSADTADAAEISNVILENPSVTAAAAAMISVGALAGEANGNVKINNVAVTGGQVKLVKGTDNGDNVGVGALLGAVRTRNYANNNADISIQNVFANTAVYGENPKGINFTSTVIGRIRGGNVGLLSDIFSMGSAVYGEALSYGVTTSNDNSAADTISNVYYTSGIGSITGCTQADFKTLREATVQLGESWVLEAGYFPYLSMMSTREGFDKEAYAVPGELSFQEEYAAPGDIITALGAPEGSTYTFRVQHVISGTTESFTNTTGSYQLREEDDESMVTVSVTGQNDASLYCSKLPVMYLQSPKAYYDVTDSYSDVDIRLVGNGENTDSKFWYNSIDGEDKTAEIKLRGNSTKYRPKRPFKLKLGTKKDLLGLGENDGESYKSKHWVLLANDIDHTLSRNKLLYDFSGEIGTEFYFHSTNVALIFNGEYKGTYQLCEHRRVDEGRIDIVNWPDIAEEIAAVIAEAEYANAGFSKASKMVDALVDEAMMMDWSWIDSKSVTYNGVTYHFADYPGAMDTWPKDSETGEYTTDGGFLMEMDFYSIGDNTLASTTTGYGQPLYFSSPEPGDDAADNEKAGVVNSFKQTSLYQYANKRTQSFEYALHSDDFIYRDTDKHYTVGSSRYNGENQGWSANYNLSDYSDPASSGKHYSELFDMDSLVNNFIFCEFVMNWDSMKNSFFYYKDVNELAKIGPQWDFDWAWGNINMYGIDTWRPTDWHTTIEYFTREQYYQSVQWNRMMIRDPWFLMKAYEKYKEIRPTAIEDMIKDGGLLDTYYAAWKNAGAANDAVWSSTYGSYGGLNYEQSWEKMTEFVKTRVKWLDEQFGDFETFMKSLGYYQTSLEIQVDSVTVGDTDTVITASVSGSDIKKAVFQINGTVQAEAEVKDGKAQVTVPTSILEQNREAGNLVHVLAKDGSDNYIYNAPASITGNYNVVKSNYKIFYNEYGEVVTPTPTPTEKPDPTPTEKPDPTPTEKPDPTPTDKPTPTPTETPTHKSHVGKTFVKGDLKYKVTKDDAKGREVRVTSLRKKKDTLTIPAKVTNQQWKETFRVTSVKSKAFKNQTIKKVVIGANVTKIGPNAFYNCKKLTSAVIGKNVKSIGVRAFYGCKKLKKVTIKSKVLKTVKKNAFKKISPKAVIYVPKGKKRKYKDLFQGRIARGVKIK